jgi:hypothetical protein
MMSALYATAREKMAVDMAKVTCGELTEANYEEFLTFVYWMGGYYNGTRRHTVVYLNRYLRAAKKVKAFCQKNPQRHRHVISRAGAWNQDTATMTALLKLTVAVGQSPARSPGVVRESSGSCNWYRRVRR